MSDEKTKSEMSSTDTAEIFAMVEAYGVDEVLENIAMVCREMGEENEDGETERVWRVRGNGVMQGLRFYQEFVKARKA